MKKRQSRPVTLIRPATSEDIPAVIDLNRDGILLWSRGFQPVIREWMESVCNPAYFEELILHPEKILLVAERKGVVCGTVYGYPEGGRFYLGGLYAAVKGQRVGTLLIEALAVEAKRLRYKELVNVVYENNYEALNFLRHHNWRIEEIEIFDDIRYCKHVLTLS